MAWPSSSESTVLAPSRRPAAGEVPLPDTWTMARGTRDGAPQDDDAWVAAQVPGTVAGALRAAGGAIPDIDLDAEDWWYRLAFTMPQGTDDPSRSPASERSLLCFDGLATIADVWLNGHAILHGESMWQAHAVDVTEILAPNNRLELRFRALAPSLARQRRPRQRWRTRLVPDGNLRWLRTMLLGRAPGLGPLPAAVGPWRPIRLVRRGGTTVDGLRVRTRLRDSEGHLTVTARVTTPAGRPVHSAQVRIDGPSGSHEAPLRLGGAAGAPTISGELTIADVAPWWPHTHGTPALHRATLVLTDETGSTEIDLGRVGFRSLAPGAGPAHRVEVDGLDLHVNGVQVFARGAVWTPPDPITLNPDPAELRATVLAARDAGLNMLRIPGTTHYESSAFHDLCDELGILVWQDLMFANLDYPFSDPEFAQAATEEVDAVVRALAWRPSLAVVCGNSEVEQQVAMMGLDPALGRGEFFGEQVPALLARADCDAVHVPSAPSGGTRPFVPDRGVANWFGVGGYGRPVEDVRAAGVRFASECLAFANVPDEAVVAAVGPRGGVPRDAGASWDFADVRDGYLRRRFGVEPDELRVEDPERYLELSRALTGEVMATVFGEWRRADSPCHGGIVLWWRDVAPGAGWGLLDHRGGRKAAYHHLRRALAPIALWIVDEGLGGLRIHVANDPPRPLSAWLTLALHRDGEHPVDIAGRTIAVAPHAALEIDAEEMLGGFVDVGHHYRFGPLSHDLVVARLEAPDGSLLGQVCRTIGPALPERHDAAGLGLRATWGPGPEPAVSVILSTRRLVRGVRLHVPGRRPLDDAFDLAPGETRVIGLERDPNRPVEAATGWVTALELHGRIEIGT